MRLVFHSKEKLNEYLSKVKLRIRECGWISLATAKMLAEYPTIKPDDHLKVYRSVEPFIVGELRYNPWTTYYTICLDKDKSCSLYDRSLAVTKSISDHHNDGLNATTYVVDEFNKIKMNGETNMGPKDETTSVNYYHDGKPIGSIVSVNMDANRNGVEIKGVFDDASMSCTIQEYIKNDIKITEEAYMDYIKAALNARWGLPLGTIEKVIFNDPATIVIWYDGSKTVVKCENEHFDPEKGLAMAISKKFFGNRGNYFDNFKKWVPKQTSGRFSWEKPEDKCALGKIIETENINRFYIELPDGYRLIVEDGEYAGRYNPESESDVTAPVTDNINAPFIAGKKHKIVCASDCYHVKNIKPENRLYFNTLAEALANGCRPCKHCNAKHKELNNEE